jgi:hypothetical protein
MLVRIPVLLLAAFLAGGCEFSGKAKAPPLPLSERVTWEGQAPIRSETDSAAPFGEDRAPAGAVRIHTLDFAQGDSLRLVLVEFPHDWEAYRAFQEKANAEEIAQGFYRDNLSLHFFQGPYLGELRHSRSALIPASFLRERLAFRGEELFRRPEIFRTFPLAGQIPASERVLTAEFLGRTGAATIFSVAYHCHEDTARLFRGIPPFPENPRSWLSAWKGQADTSGWSEETRFSGFQEDGDPLVFWNFRGGFLGVAGCFDSLLAWEYAEKMKKMTILLEEP